MASDEVNSTTELQRIVTLVQELTSRAVRTESVAELFTRGFPALFRCVPFDLGVAVMIEQNLDLFITTREDAGHLVSDELVARIKETLEKLIPVSFESTEVIVKGEFHDLPGRGTPAPRLGFDTWALIKQEQRTAGVLILFREDSAFRADERQVLDVFSMQMSMLLTMIRARERILSLAETDELTGILNKRAFRRQLPQEMERSRTYSVPLSLLVFDIDDFKQINDSLGHVTGDVVLSDLCGAVKGSLRPPDVMFRFGGDEFVVMLPHTDTAGATAVGERVLDRVRTLTIPTDEEGSVRCSVSIGIAEYDDKTDSAWNDFFARADEQLRRAKRQGKNRMCVR